MIFHFLKNKYVVIILFLVGFYFFFRFFIFPMLFSPNDNVTEIGVTQENADLFSDPNSGTVVVENPVQQVVHNLEIPWEVVFLEDGSMLITERVGKLIRIFPDYRSVIEVEGVEHTGEGGLLGMALDPDFSDNQFVYLYLTSKEDSMLTNKVERYRYDLNENVLQDRKIIIDEILGANYHDGGRIAFGPDGFLYITTGDAGKPDSAQDINSLAGKILRINAEGDIPDDNPFGNEVWSYGHRNPQGIAWDSQGRLWSSEHGPSGTETGHDEVNLIVKGGNYGWPEIRGGETQEEMISPVIYSELSTTWAPADLEVFGDMLFFTGLRGESLYSAKIDGDTLIDLKANFHQEYGRMRVVRIGNDGWLYVTTSNLDGRGAPSPEDDQLLKISMDLFK